MLRDGRLSLRGSLSPIAIGASLVPHVGVCAALGASPRASVAEPRAPVELLDVVTEAEPPETPLAERVALAATPAPPRPTAPRAEAPAVHAVAATPPPPATPPPADAPAAMTSDDALPTFTLAVVATPGAGASPVLAPAAGTGAPSAVVDDDATYGAEAVDVPAPVVSQSMPRYPPAARAAGSRGA